MWSFELYWTLIYFNFYNGCVSISAVASNRKPNKIWVDKGSAFYTTSVKSWLEKNSIEMYSSHNERKSVIAERFLRTLKNKIYKSMTSNSKKCLYW